MYSVLAPETLVLFLDNLHKLSPVRRITYEIIYNLAGISPSIEKFKLENKRGSCLCDHKKRGGSLMLPHKKEAAACSSPLPKLQQIFTSISLSTREDFSLSIIGPLVNSAYGAELIRTLEQYLTDNLNVSQAAKHLYLHRNTLLYRLAKIRSLTGLDPRNFDQAMELKLALSLWIYNNEERSSNFLRRVNERGEQPPKYAVR